MIPGFAKETAPLTKQEEEQLLPALIDELRGRTKANPIKGHVLCRRFPQLTGARLRKLTNHIRSKSLLPVIATSCGYYTSYEKNEISFQIRSLVERALAINKSADGLRQFLEEAV